MAEKSLWDTLSGLLGGGGEEAKAKEMVTSPPPPKPVVERKPGESDLDFSLRSKKALRTWEKEIEDRKLYPSKYLVSPAEGSELSPGERDRFDRRTQIESAIDEAD